MVKTWLGVISYTDIIDKAILDVPVKVRCPGCGQISAAIIMASGPDTHHVCSCGDTIVLNGFVRPI